MKLGQRFLVIGFFMVLIFGIVATSCTSPKPATSSAPSSSAATTAATSAAPKGEVFKWRYTTIDPPTSNTGKVMKRMSDKIAERSGGRLIVEVFWGGQLAYKGTETMTLFRDNLIETANVTLAQNDGEVPWFGVVDLPKLLDSADQVETAMNKLKPMYEAVFDKYNAIPLAYYGYPARTMMFYSNKPIRTTADAKGLKIRVNAQTVSRFVTNLGMQPLFIAYAEVVQALKTGVVDAMVTGTGAMIENKMDETIKYVTAGVYANTAPRISAVSKTAYNKLPPDLQVILKDAMAEMAWQHTYMIQDFTLMEEDWINYANSHGVTIIKLAPEVKAEWTKMAESTWDDWAKEKGEDAKKALEIVKKVRADWY